MRHLSDMCVNDLRIELNRLNAEISFLDSEIDRVLFECDNSFDYNEDFGMGYLDELRIDKKHFFNTRKWVLNRIRELDV